MNMNLVDDITQTLRRTRNEDINRQQKEIYLQMASQMNQMIQSMQDEQSRFKRLANMASEAGNLILTEQFQQLARKMNQELDAMDDLIRTTRSIANQ